MKRILLAGFALAALAAAPAMAQSGAAGAGGPSGGAGQTPQGAALNNNAAAGSGATTDRATNAHMNTPGAMTESQAKAKIESTGFSSVSGLAVGPDGSWHARAMRGGSSVNVGIDPQGNVSATTPP